MPRADYQAVADGDIDCLTENPVAVERVGDNLRSVARGIEGLETIAEAAVVGKRGRVACVLPPDT